MKTVNGRHLRKGWMLIPVLCGCLSASPSGHSRSPDDVSVAFSPKGDVLVFSAMGTGGRDLFLLRLNNLTVSRVAETPEYEIEPEFSPDGKFLVYVAGLPGDRADHVFIRPVVGGAATQLTNADANDTMPSFSPDGSQIVFARDKTYAWGGLAQNWNPGGVICVVSRTGGKERQLTPDREYTYAPSFSADGTSVIYSTETGRASVSLASPSTPKPLPGPSGAVPSPDGKWIAYTRGEYAPDLKLFLADAQAKSELCLTPDEGWCHKPVFRHGGNCLYFLREEWPDGPGGEPKFSLWSTQPNRKSCTQIADYHLFDSPLTWKPTKTAKNGLYE